jgi:uncharacterized protein involved in exopolysaccharide biosynthesis
LLVKGDAADATLWSAVEQFRSAVLNIREDPLKGVTRVAIEWPDPAVCAQWANAFVALANELIRERALNDAKRNIAYLNEQIDQTTVVELKRVMYNLVESEMQKLMLANARTDFAFAVVDPAVPPELRIKPRRTVMVAIGGMMGLLLGIVSAFFHTVWLRRNRASERGR